MEHIPWPNRVINALSNPPKKLYHATTVGKLEKYENTGLIYPPVRGFDTLEGVQEWARLVNSRTIILEFEVDVVQALPDHHNKYGLAWWSPKLVTEWKVIENAK